MHTTNLRKVGGSIMLAVPPAILDLLQLHAGATVGLAVEHGRLLIEPTPRPRYSLDELLAQLINVGSDPVKLLISYIILSKIWVKKGLECTF